MDSSISRNTQMNKAYKSAEKLMDTIGKIGIETDRDNANVGNNFSSKLLRIASESNKWYNLANMPPEYADMHLNGDMHIHDLDSYNLTTNCLHMPVDKLLENGFNNGYGTIRPPKRILSAAELICILFQSSQNDMFGGQSIDDFDNYLAPYIDKTRQELKAEYPEKVEQRMLKELHQAMQGIVYNLNTMHSRAGSQVPFSSINLGLPRTKDAALVCKAFLEEYEKGLGKGEQPIFPNIIFRVKDGVNKKVGDPYYYLYKLACRVASKRMNPTFMNIDADFNKKYYDKGIVPATMGCRTYVCSNVNGPEGPKGRGNIAPISINLPRLGIEASRWSTDGRDGTIHSQCERESYFFGLLDNMLDVCRKSLMHRYSVLKRLKVKDLPFVAGQKLMVGSENLKPKDSIEPILKQGTWVIGFIGLAETLVALTGKHHGEDEYSRELGLKIVKYIRDYTDRLTKETHLNWSCYATPAEGLSGRFTKKDRKKFGIIKGVTDKEYYTNSFHIPVGFNISIKDKIDIEAPYHKLCNGGHISYVEFDDYPTPDVVENIITYAYTHTNISYLGINFHIRYCRDCGTYLNNNETKCPHCGSDSIQGISRTTGYLSLDERFTPGKVAERADRVSHVTGKKIYK